ncbi:flagellin [Sinorhizobium meliloti]|uniref:flagellin N-terminal helical domain-containing protein n=5 Tax=Rhizobium meliloti TaxID=382 RepID=UPI00299F1985|nr:flagellin [Sinorhizobium meliloti]MDW9491904.1 flagellin [Sinorhizobium meliloti]MDW9560609.1 flagellin [Sinorhizobium meliloti]MDW9638996.1 flagellin [Sinorhizobium meliloti]MDW9647678.1 flagellin [Sinorhizobium meliloti]
MTSILTNIAAMAALQTLRTIGSNMEETQAHVSSGLRVGGAADNAAYWSIATTMRSDNMALSAVQDALGLGAAKVDTAYSGMESAIEVVKEIKKKLVAASEDGVDKNKIQEEISQLQDQLTSIAEAASFSGENWLQADLSGGNITKSVVGSFVRDASGNVSVKKVNYDLSGSSVLFDTAGDTGILDATTTIEGNGVSVDVNIGGTVDSYNVVKYTTEQVIADGATFDSGGKVAVGGTAGFAGYVKVADDTWVAAIDQSAATDHEIFATDTDNGDVWAIDETNLASAAAMTASVSTFEIDETTTATQISGLISMVDAALETMTSAAADLGSIGMRIDLQSEFVSKLTDSIDSGVGRLVDADMNEESTRLKALQTQQQLAIQSLSIANSASESILTLFR